MKELRLLVLYVLFILAMLGQTVLAQGRPSPSGSYGPRPPRIEPLRIEDEKPLGFLETQQVLKAVANIIPELTVGQLVQIQTPQGLRLSLPLLFKGKVVSRAFIGSAGTLISFSHAMQLSPAKATASLSANVLNNYNLRVQVKKLTASGVIQARRGEYRITLLLGQQQVAMLLLDRKTMLPKPDLGMLGRPMRPSPNEEGGPHGPNDH